MDADILGLCYLLVMTYVTDKVGLNGLTAQTVHSDFTQCNALDHTHARARLAPQISKPQGGWDLARSRVFSQATRDAKNIQNAARVSNFF